MSSQCRQQTELLADRRRDQISVPHQQHRWRHRSGERGWPVKLPKLFRPTTALSDEPNRAGFRAPPSASSHCRSLDRFVRGRSPRASLQRRHSMHRGDPCRQKRGQCTEGMTDQDHMLTANRKHARTLGVQDDLEVTLPLPQSRNTGKAPLQQSLDGSGVAAGVRHDGDGPSLGDKPAQASANAPDPPPVRA